MYCRSFSHVRWRPHELLLLSERQWKHLLHHWQHQWRYQLPPNTQRRRSSSSRSPKASHRRCAQCFWWHRCKYRRNHLRFLASLKKLDVARGFHAGRHYWYGCQVWLHGFIWQKFDIRDWCLRRIRLLAQGFTWRPVHWAWTNLKNQNYWRQRKCMGCLHQECYLPVWRPQATVWQLHDQCRGNHLSWIPPKKPNNILVATRSSGLGNSSLHLWDKYLEKSIDFDDTGSRDVTCATFSTDGKILACATGATHGDDISLHRTSEWISSNEDGDNGTY